MLDNSDTDLIRRVGYVREQSFSLMDELLRRLGPRSRVAATVCTEGRTDATSSSSAVVHLQDLANKLGELEMLLSDSALPLRARTDSSPIALGAAA